MVFSDPKPPPLGQKLPESETQDLLPLPKEIVEGLETAASLQFEAPCWEDVMENAPVLSKEELQDAGYVVLEGIPATRSAFKKAMEGQSVVFMDGTGIAREAAETLKEWRDSDGDLFSRVCAEENKAGTANEKKQPRNQRKSKGSRPRKSKGSRPPPDQKKGFEDSRKPDIQCILRVIHAYCEGCNTNFKSIFQRFAANESEDKRRREYKGHKWERPVRKSGESEESFLDRVAGYRVLLKFYELVYYRTVNVLPRQAKVNSSFSRYQTSLLLSDARRGDVGRQDNHVDMAPMVHELCLSLLMNLSLMMGYLGLLVNSGPNIDNALDFESKELGKNESFNQEAHLNGRFKNRYLITKSAGNPEQLLSEVMSEKGHKEEDVLRHAWSLHLQAHAADHPDQFRKMRGIWAQMPPLMLVAFTDRVLHCGPPFPMPFENREDLESLMHFRSVTPFYDSDSAEFRP
jgi:hypothetical protein